MSNGILSIDELFEPLIGTPCWNVKQGHGSFLTLEFGDPHLEIHEPRVPSEASPRLHKVLTRRRVAVRGRWHLWIYCCDWMIHVRGQELAWSESPRAEIAAACEFLDGQALQEVTIGPSIGGTRFWFDLEGLLTTEPHDSELTEQWMLYCPDGNVYAHLSDGTTIFEPASCESD